MTDIDDYLKQTFGLEGTIALVTGASRGIGAAIASSLARAGAIVHVHGRDAAALAPIAARTGGRAWVADLSRPEAVSALADEFIDEVGTLDLLVNNAGVELPATLEGLDDETLHETFQVNLFAAIQLSRRLAGLLRRSADGSILNVSSIHETVPSHGNSAYAASKAALRSITATLAIELGPDRVRVNSIAPGAIATDINRKILERIGLDQFADWIPLGRVGEVSEVGDAAVFLASAAARYVTGASLTIDGGYSHHLVRYRGSDH